MKLTIKDRLIMPGLCPEESDLMTLILVKDITKKVEFSQKELEEIEFKSVDGRHTWNSEKEKDIEIKFTDSELNLLKNQVNKLDSEKKTFDSKREKLKEKYSNLKNERDSKREEMRKDLEKSYLTISKKTDSEKSE